MSVIAPSQCRLCGAKRDSFQVVGDFVFGGKRIGLRLRNAKIEKLYEGEGRLDEWIETIRRVIGETEGS